MTEIELRPARREEARTIAALYQISSDGVADYIWSGMRQPGEDLLDVGTRRYARENTDFSFQNVTLALTAGEIAGMMAAYPMGPADRPGDEFDFDVDPVLLPYHKLEQPNSFYVSGMALFARFRGRGIGTALLELASAKSRALNLPQLSLIVFEQNTGARRLYERFGFREAMREAVVAHPLLHFGGAALLMVKNIN